MSGSGPGQLAVSTSVLSDTAGRIEAATRTIRDLRDRAGVLRGRAGDSGDDELRAAVVGFVQVWGDGLESLRSETSRWAALLSVAADLYARAEDGVATSFGADAGSR